MDGWCAVAMQVKPEQLSGEHLVLCRSNNLGAEGGASVAEALRLLTGLKTLWLECVDWMGCVQWQCRSCQSS